MNGIAVMEQEVKALKEINEAINRRIRVLEYAIAAAKKGTATEYERVIYADGILYKGDT